MKMKASNLQVITALLNLIFLGLIVMDTFILEPSTTVSILQKMDLKIGYTRSGSILHYQLIDEKGKKYNVPYDSFSELNIGDSLFISRSGLFKKALFLSYHKDKVNRVQGVGLLTNSGFAVFIITIIGILLLLALFLPFLSGNRRMHIELLIMMTFVNIVLLTFYFLKQS